MVGFDAEALEHGDEEIGQGFVVGFELIDLLLHGCGISVAEYGKSLEANLQGLIDRVIKRSPDLKNRMP